MSTTHRTALTLLALLAAGLTACTSSGSGGDRPTATRTAAAPPGGHTSASAPASGPASTGTTSATTSAAPPPPTVVHVSAMESDGATYGVGMPIVLFFTPAPTDSSAFTKAVKVTVNGKPVDGAWFWEQPTADEVQSHTVEAHYRLQQFWPADSHVHISVPIKGLSAGKGMVYSGALTSLDFHIGDKHVAHVNGKAEKMRVYSNGKLIRTVPVSLGQAKRPTYEGVKVVMQKGEDAPGTGKLRPDGAVRMQGCCPHYDELVDWSVRVTGSGEYVHAAPWNSLIGRQSTSHGCTNLSTADAKWYYGFAREGDVVTYTHTGGPTMPVWDGLGDWNVPWSQWARGGLLLNH